MDVERHEDDIEPQRHERCDSSDPDGVLTVARDACHRPDGDDQEHEACDEEGDAAAPQQPGVAAFDPDPVAPRLGRGDARRHLHPGQPVAVLQEVTGTPGQAREAVLEVGGVMGVGGRTVVVPLNKITVGPDGRLLTTMTEDELKLLPKAP